MDWIDNIVVGLFETYGTNDPYEICQIADIQIIRVERSNLILMKNNSAYYRDKLDREIIYIADDLEPEHEKFYISHELGHAILHVHIKNSYNRFLLNKGKMEKQANYFALKLSNISFDEIELYELTIEQIASFLEIPLEPLMQLANL